MSIESEYKLENVAASSVPSDQIDATFKSSTIGECSFCSKNCCDTRRTKNLDKGLGVTMLFVKLNVSAKEYFYAIQPAVDDRRTDKP